MSEGRRKDSLSSQLSRLLKSDSSRVSHGGASSSGSDQSCRSGRVKALGDLSGQLTDTSGFSTLLSNSQLDRDEEENKKLWGDLSIEWDESKNLSSISGTSTIPPDFARAQSHSLFEELDGRGVLVRDIDSLEFSKDESSFTRHIMLATFNNETTLPSICEVANSDVPLDSSLSTILDPRLGVSEPIVFRTCFGNAVFVETPFLSSDFPYLSIDYGDITSKDIILKQVSHSKSLKLSLLPLTPMDSILTMCRHSDSGGVLKNFKFRVFVEFPKVFPVPSSIDLNPVYSGVQREMEIKLTNTCSLPLSYRCLLSQEEPFVFWKACEGNTCDTPEIPPNGTFKHTLLFKHHIHGNTVRVLSGRIIISIKCPFPYLKISVATMPIAAHIIPFEHTMESSQNPLDSSSLARQLSLGDVNYNFGPPLEVSSDHLFWTPSQINTVSKVKGFYVKSVAITNQQVTLKLSDDNYQFSVPGSERCFSFDLEPNKRQYVSIAFFPREIGYHSTILQVYSTLSPHCGKIKLFGVGGLTQIQINGTAFESTPYISLDRICKPLIFETQIILKNVGNSIGYYHIVPDEDISVTPRNGAIKAQQSLSINLQRSFCDPFQLFPPEDSSHPHYLYCGIIKIIFGPEVMFKIIKRFMEEYHMYQFNSPLDKYILRISPLTATKTSPDKLSKSPPPITVFETACQAVNSLTLRKIPVLLYKDLVEGDLKATSPNPHMININKMGDLSFLELSD